MSFLFGSSFSKEKSFKLADKYTQQGQFDAAIEEYGKILNADPYDLAAMNALGNLYLRLNRNQEAIPYLLYVADCYRDGGSISMAIAIYKKINKVEPRNGDVLLKLAELYGKQGQVLEARQHYLLVINLYRRTNQMQEVTKTVEKVVEMDQENLSAQLDFADALNQQGFGQQALDVCLQAGKRFSRIRKYDESIQAFQKALSYDTDSKIALKGIIEVYNKQNNFQAALEVLNLRLVLRPEDVDVLEMMGQMYLGVKKLDLAESTYQRLLQIDSSRGDTLIEVAQAFVGLGQFDRAMETLDKCLVQVLAKGQKKKATALLKDIFQKDPQNLNVLFRLSHIYRQLNEKRNLTTTLNSVIDVAGRLGRHDIALEAAQQLVALGPQRKVDKQKTANAEEGTGLLPGLESGPALMEQMRKFDSGVYQRVGTELEDQKAFKPIWERSLQESEIDGSTEILETFLEKNPDYKLAKVRLIEELVAQHPDSIEKRDVLKHLYLDLGVKEKAATQARELSRLYENQGNATRAKELLMEAYELNPQSVATPTGTLPATLIQTITHFETDFTLDEIANLKQFKKQLERELRRVVRRKSSEPLSLIKISVDFFAEYKKIYGPQGVAQCLVNVAEALENLLKRPGDLLGYGGNEEFLALLPETQFEGAILVAEKLRAQIQASGIKHQGSPAGQRVTISLGVVTTIPHQKSSPGTLLATVDLFVKEAQARGGNQVYYMINSSQSMT